MSIRLFGSVGVGLASKFCSNCGCDCYQACNCELSPTSISFWMAAPEFEMSQYTCASCGYLTPFEVTLNTDLCSDELRYNNQAAFTWLFRDGENLCDSPGTPTQPMPCSAAECAYLAPFCNVACFSGEFWTPCYSCEYTGLPEEQGNYPDYFSVKYHFQFRALLGTVGYEDGTPVCGLVLACFVKFYLAETNDCTDMWLISVTRSAYSATIVETCCGTTTSDIARLGDPTPLTGVYGCDGLGTPPTGVGAIVVLLGQGPVYVCWPDLIFPAPPGEAYKRKLTINC